VGHNIPENPPLRLGLANAISHWAIYRTDTPALVVGSERVGYKQLHQQSLEIELALANSVMPEERVALVVESKLSFIPALVAIIRAGCTAVIAQPGWTQEQLHGCFAANRVAAVVHDVECGSPTLSKGAKLPMIRLPIRTGAKAHGRPVVSRNASDEWAVLFSSGTTGKPKGMVRSDNSVLNELMGWCLELGIRGDTRFYVGRPLFYTGGLMLTASTMLVGGSAIVPASHDDAAFCALCQENPPDLCFLVPSQIQRLVERARSAVLPPLRTTILTMGSFIEPALKVEAASILGCKVIESWGNSEGLGTITTPEDLASRPSSVGRPFLCDRILVVDEEGKVQPPGQLGRLAGFADSTLSYYESREDLNRCLIRDGMVISEDIGSMDAEGYVYLAGRADDFVTINGSIVNLREIDRALCRLPEVAAACVIDIAEPAQPPRIMAAIEPRPSAVCDRDGIVRQIHEAGGPGTCLERVLVIEQLERNAAGKIHVESVRDRLRSAFATTEPTSH
jgi:acyl-coenzyme A synthetase/AMP-(fatty) acid ligase